MRPKQKKNTLYHLYNRGNRKCKICEDKKDFDLLCYLLHTSFLSREYDILTFCIMPNHYHILLSQSGKTSIGMAMQRFGCKYSKYFNKRHHYVGHVFQGTYKYKAVTTSSYLDWLVKYIKNNPIGMNKFCRGNCSRYYRNQKLIDLYRFFLREDL